MTPTQIESLIQAEATKNGLRPELFRSMLNQESRLNPNAVNAASGASGIAQFMPATAKWLKIDPMKPEQAIPASAKYLKGLIDKFGGSEKSGLQAYNWGEGNLQKYLAKGSKGMMPKETQDYTVAILGNANGGRTSAPSGQADPRRFAQATPSTDTHLPIAQINTAQGPRLVAPSNAEEADWFQQIAGGNHTLGMEQNLTMALAQLLPAKEMLDSKNMFDKTEHPHQLDPLIDDLLARA
jgi:Transglycosylase SLT domain